MLGGARDAQLMVLSGFALEMLGAAEKAPLDSRTAIGRAITQASASAAHATALAWGWPSPPAAGCASLRGCLSSPLPRQRMPPSCRQARPLQ